MVDKYFIGSQEIYEDSFRLARKVYDSGFRPDFIVALWRGGALPGKIVQEALAFWGVQTDHIAIRTSGREEDNSVKDTIMVHNLGYLIKNVEERHSLLLIDDVWDTGRTLVEVIRTYRAQSRMNAAHDIRTGVVYFKPKCNEMDSRPDYFVNEDNRWLVFPHEVMNLTHEEIRSGKGPVISEILLGNRT